MDPARSLNDQTRVHLFQPVYNRRRSYRDRVLSLAPFAYWPLDEASGPTLADLAGNGYHGTGSAGLTYGNVGPGRYNKSLYLDGNEYIGLPAAFGTAFPVNCAPQGSMCIWAQADNWTAGVSLFTFLVNANNQVTMQKNNTLDRVTAMYYAGGVYKSVAEANGQTSTGWRWYCMTWDKNAGADGEMKFFVDSVQIGATQTGLGTWSGNLATAARVLGATDNLGNGGWLGYLCEVVLFDRAITPAERAVVFAL